MHAHSIDEVLQGLSVTDIEQMGGPTRRAVRKMLEGRPTRSDAVARLARVLAIDVDELQRLVDKRRRERTPKTLATWTRAAARNAKAAPP